ncbi:hypothetical protein Adt_13695 [Abeliophyllum distichum]|uniref:Uncharacterized protein n=1 Tax=Abeliophyllum distichum TaxID=126358 RepID=A0ABD1TY16_9LAMI
MSRVVSSGSGGGMKKTGGAGEGNGGRKRNEERRIPRVPVVTSSSSIGKPSDDDDGGENEVQSEISNGALNSIASLEDSLPMKRGLSMFYNGKSKSFVNLSGQESKLEMKELEKPDHIVNKKRRLIVAEKLSRKNSRHSLPAMRLNTNGETSKNRNNGKEESDDQLI